MKKPDISKLPEHARQFFRDYFAKYPDSAGNQEMNEWRVVFHPSNPPCVMCEGTVMDHHKDCIAYIEPRRKVWNQPITQP